jgi:hypothetical protein
MPQDLIFRYGQLPAATPPDGDFNGDLVVDAADYVVWRKTAGSPAAYDLWKANFGEVAPSSGPSTLIQGFVRYVPSGSGGGGAVPEPTDVIFIGIGLFAMAAGARQRFEDN